MQLKSEIKYKIQKKNNNNKTKQKRQINKYKIKTHIRYKTKTIKRLKNFHK